MLPMRERRLRVWITPSSRPRPACPLTSRPATFFRPPEPLLRKEGVPMSQPHPLLDRMEAQAANVAATVSRVASLEAALAYVTAVCAAKAPCQRLRAGDETQPAAPGEQPKIIAAPGLPEAAVAALRQQAAPLGMTVITDGLRRHLGGIDVAFTLADAGLAATGTLVLRCADEELRLATMLAETHIALLPASRIAADADALEPTLAAWMGQPGYTAFITGPSRTADIERVTALGVHGPLELHILIREDD